MACRDCLHLDVKPDKRGRIMPRRNETYRCLAPLPDLPPLPASVFEPRWPPAKSYMAPDEGEGCVAHVRRPPAENSPSDMAAEGGLPPLSAPDDPTNPDVKPLNLLTPKESSSDE